MPSPMQVFAFIMVTYFFVTGGVIYDIINEPPSIGKFCFKPFLPSSVLVAQVEWFSLKYRNHICQSISLS